MFQIFYISFPETKRKRKEIGESVTFFEQKLHRKKKINMTALDKKASPPPPEAAAAATSMLAVFGKKFVIGSFGGVCQAICSHPADVVKTRLQSGLFPNITTTIRETLTKEGPLAFYKGISPPIATAGLYNAVLFSSNEISKKTLIRIFDLDTPTSSKPLPLQYTMLAGIMAAPSACAVVSPADAVKIQLQNQKEAKGKAKYKGHDRLRRQHGQGRRHQEPRPRLLRDAGDQSDWTSRVFRRKSNRTAGVEAAHQPELVGFLDCDRWRLLRRDGVLGCRDSGRQCQGESSSAASWLCWRNWRRREKDWDGFPFGRFIVSTDCPDFIEGSRRACFERFQPTCRFGRRWIMEKSLQRRILIGKKKIKAWARRIFRIFYLKR